MMTNYSQSLSHSVSPSQSKHFHISAKVMLTLFAMTFSAASLAEHYTRTDLTVNASPSSPSVHVDANLINAWGLARTSTGPWWISDNGTGHSTLYDATGLPRSLVVTIPLPNGDPGSAPTGTVFNPSSSFKIQQNGKTDKAIFLFVTEDGTISGWNPSVNGTQAVIAVDRSGKAIYKGCALADTEDGPLLYATNFQTGRVEVFDGNFNRLPHDDSAFRINGSHYSPFNIQNVGGNLVVTFAKKQPGATDEDQGPGLGRVAVFDVKGKKLHDLQRGRWLNAPWGIALAPNDFGAFSHRLLIGNFGDGKIHAFNAVTGDFEGTLLAADDKPQVIDGLWAISFGGGNLNSGAANELFFTAGPHNESDGLFGKLVAAPEEQKGNTE